MNYLETIRNDRELWNALDTLCDFRIGETLTELDENYLYAKETFRIFGRDASGGEFGFVGDGDAETCPIGYAGSEGKAGIMAQNIAHFFALITFYPFWHDLMSLKVLTDNVAITELEDEYRDEFENYEVLQALIAHKLHLSKDAELLLKFHSALLSEQTFITYATVDDNPSEDLFM